MTRGRHANHIHLAPGDETVTDNHLPRTQPGLGWDARAVLEGMLARSGAQQSAHDVRDAARLAHAGRRNSAVLDTLVTRQDTAPPDLPGDPAARLKDELAARSRQRDQLRYRLQDVSVDRLQLTAQLSGVRWWEMGLRSRLEKQLSAAANEQTTVKAQLRHCEASIGRLQDAVRAQADKDARQRAVAAAEKQRRERAWRPPPAKLDDTLARLVEKVARRERNVAPAAAMVAPAPPTVTPAPPRRGIGR